MLRYLIGFAIALTALAAVYAILQRFWPSIRGQRLYRRGFYTDLAYWVLSPAINRGVAQVALICALIPIAVLLGIALPDLKNGWGYAASLPLWLQAIAIVVLGDFFAYWIHRFTHRGWWWQVHAVHHSSQQLDWLAAARVHPLNDAIGLIGRVAPLVALGFAPISVAGTQPFFTLYAITLHANLNWDYGPLRAVIASPRFHRWHHTSAEQCRDKNFSGFLPIWDVIFGTCPKASSPRSSASPILYRRRSPARCCGRSAGNAKRRRP